MTSSSPHDHPTLHLPVWRVLLVALATCLLAAACSSDGTSGSAEVTTTSTATPSTSPESSLAAEITTETSSNQASEFPRSVDHALGTAEILAMPERIVSASATMTGHLLAIGAPVVAAQTLPPQSPLADENGFLVQWGDVALSAGVEAISGPEVNIEAIAAQRPDLIIANSFGGDAVTEDVYSLLTEIAPTIVIDHSGLQWQELAVLLGEATGRADGATRAIADFDLEIAAALPTLDQRSDVFPAVVSANGINAFTAESSHGKLFESLGYHVPKIEGSNLIQEAGQATRSDVVSISPENVVDIVGEARFLFVFSTPEEVPELIEAFPTLAAIPSISSDSALALGVESFRIDRYSASIIVDRLIAAEG